jgi:hypothetical protein
LLIQEYFDLKILRFVKSLFMLSHNVSSAVFALWVAALVITAAKCTALHPKYVLADIQLVGASRAGKPCASTAGIGVKSLVGNHWSCFLN